MSLFLDAKHHIVFEGVAPDGSHPDTHEGRLINPGHGIEGMWFVMDVARRRNDQVLMNRAVDATLSILAYGWDETYGGIVAFKDFLGKPTDFLEWDQKLWWVHVETLIALLMAFVDTGDDVFWRWFKKDRTDEDEEEDEDVEVAISEPEPKKPVPKETEPEEAEEKALTIKKGSGEKKEKKEAEA